MTNYVPLRMAIERLGLHPNNLRKYVDGGKIDFIKNEAGQRLYNVESYIGKHGSTAVICYARVSSRHQSNDLPRQRKQLLSSYPGSEVITDIGSGAHEHSECDFKRKGLLSILERLMQGDKLTLIVAHKDRLARFGFDLIEWMVAPHPTQRVPGSRHPNGGAVVVLNRVEHSPQQEPVADLLVIITVFGARVNGLRRYSKQIEEDSDLSNEAAAKPD